MVDNNIINLSLRGVDIVKALFEAAISQRDYSQIEYNSLTEEINQFTNVSINVIENNKREVTCSLELSEYEKELCRNYELRGELYQKSNVRSHIHKLLVELHKDARMKSVVMFQILLELKSFGTVLISEPKDDASISDEEFGDTISILFVTHQAGEVISKTIDSIAGVERTLVEKLENSKFEGNSKNHKVEKIRTTEKNISTIRVDVAKIDHLVNLLGEFIIDKEALNQLSTEFKARHKNDPFTTRFTNLMAHVNYLTASLQETILSTRMLPLDNIFSRFPRMVRDISQKLNKEVNFIMEGGQTEIDRGIIEELVDPITHILRNALDHGIESLEERKKNGKDPIATLKLSATHKEGYVFIEITEDGGGINLNKVKERAIELGVRDAEVIRSFSNEEIIKLIFEPGFSTAASVSDLSGRGVGMDIVRSNIEKLHGSVHIKTEEGQGTSITIKLPLTLAIVRALLFQEGEYKFAVPVISIIEVMQFKEKEYRKNISIVKDSMVLNWRDRVIPIIDVGKFFSINENGDNEKIHLMIVNCNDAVIAIKTGKLLSNQEIVIKSLSQYVGEENMLGKMKGITGISIIGDGSLVYMLDVAGFRN